MMMPSSKAVIEVYQAVSGIEGIIALWLISECYYAI
jgi:hypothetical protein